jgi:hypothetical protein
MPDFGSFRAFGDKLVEGQTPTQLGLLGSENVEPLILDSYPNAAAAYSVRLLRTLYTGNAIRVRRSSDNTEQDIGFSGENLDTLSLTSFCSGTNGFVTTWYDQSGNGRNATQTTAVNQPQIVQNGSIIFFNQKPTLQFNGSNFYRSSNGVLNNSIIDAFVSLMPQQIEAGQVVFALPQATTHTSPFARFWLFLSISETQVRQNGTSFATTQSSANVKYLFNINSSNANVYRNGNAIISTKSTDAITYPNSVPFIIGANGSNAENFIGLLTELVIYTSSQSSSRAAIETNINSYYAIY